MRVKWVLAGVAGWVVMMGPSLSQSGSAEAILTNAADAKWSHDAGDPPGSESVLLRADEKSGGLELFVRFPAGHVFAPHWHASNERIIVLEGRLSLGQGQAAKYLDQGGFAYLLAKQVQYLSCVSKTRCGFYLAWDGDPRTHKPPAQ
jgi:quercetin dioxygenase-like cupin family protein